VFQWAEAASGDKGHRVDVTEGDPETIGLVTGANLERYDTGVTQGKVKVGT